MLPAGTIITNKVKKVAVKSKPIEANVLAPKVQKIDPIVVVPASKVHDEVAAVVAFYIRQPPWLQKSPCSMRLTISLMLRLIVDLFTVFLSVSFICLIVVYLFYVLLF